MYNGRYAGSSTLKAKNEFGIPPMTFYAEEPELGHRENFGDSADDMVLQNEKVGRIVSIPLLLTYFFLNRMPYEWRTLIVIISY
jgi:hypothetical protein